MVVFLENQERKRWVESMGDVSHACSVVDPFRNRNIKIKLLCLFESYEQFSEGKILFENIFFLLFLFSVKKLFRSILFKKRLCTDFKLETMFHKTAYMSWSFVACQSSIQSKAWRYWREQSVSRSEYEVRKLRLLECTWEDNRDDFKSVWARPEKADERGGLGHIFFFFGLQIFSTFIFNTGRG